ncbi:hypothetical protein GCM10027275_14520 [Rhabdobacter roseus]|uniref:Secretion system C-terminal sorting domain-containing protein n=1 Tax=Rhabdobacter roseus TaxID=1655419 RepID=A0A840TJ18_9BACT|nr:T9SS type A sorting domain-containing protein [Rhabdobacter roseus]MBB5283371.1 hypothetical protein [Rhabdobacter roseus]
MKKRLLAISILVISLNEVLAQGCQTDFVLSPVTGTNAIEWDKFPEFNLPFTIIYNGPRFGDTQSAPLKHGFSHIAYFSGPESTLPVKNRALLWNSVASIDGSGQPWSEVGLQSPWGNDADLYRNHWANYLRGLANIFDDSRGQAVPRADIICLDVERMQREDRDILRLKTDPRIPENYRQLSDAEFLSTYKRDIRARYTEAIQYYESLNPDPNTKLSSYSDVPVRGTWLNVTANSWPDWTTNPARTHYLMQNDAGRVGGSFYEKMDFLTPSPYYFYEYNNPLGKDYLSYLLFQIEVNRAWSNKPQVPFVWMRYHDSFNPGAPQIPSFVAEATAIFPFMAGAKGLWLWENNMFENTRQENYAAYEHFIYGLYRLSRFADMFEGDYQLVAPRSARDDMEQRTPIWRGVVKGNQILVAAQNPFATENQDTPLRVTHAGWSRELVLKGREVFLCRFDLGESPLSEVLVVPNPTQSAIEVLLSGLIDRTEVEYTLWNVAGIQLQRETFLFDKDQINYPFDLPVLPAGMYIVKLTQGSQSISRKLIVNP